MANEARFGLSLSLVEALKADPSADAAALVDLLTDDEGVVPPSLPTLVNPELAVKRTTLTPTARVRRRSAFAAAFAAMLGLGGHGYAAAADLQGRWTMAPAQSSFLEKVTGPAPDTVSLIVTRDDRDGLSYKLIESRLGAEVARGVYDISFAGAQSSSSTAGPTLKVTAERNEHGDVVIRAPPVGGLQALIRLRRTGRDTAVLEHDVEGAAGSIRLETISLVRTVAYASK